MKRLQVIQLKMMCEHLTLCCWCCAQCLVSNGEMCDIQRIFIRRTSLTDRWLWPPSRSRSGYSEIPALIWALPSLRWCQRFLLKWLSLATEPLRTKKDFPSRPRSAQRAEWFRWPLSATFPVFLSTVSTPEQTGHSLSGPATLHSIESLPAAALLVFPGSSEQLEEGRAARYWQQFQIYYQH